MSNVLSTKISTTYRHKEERSDGVEANTLHNALGLGEGVLWSFPWQLVDDDGPGLGGGRNGGEVVSLAVPAHLRHLLVDGQNGGLV